MAVDELPHPSPPAPTMPQHEHHSDDDREHLNTVSTGGVVPDSEGAPTQALAPGPMVVDDSPVAQEEEPIQEEEEQQASEAVEVPVAARTVAAPAPTTKGKGKGKAKKTAPARKKTTTASNQKGKGRAVAPQPSESPDELDLFQPSDLRLPVDQDSDEQMETNYEEPPMLTNAKTRSPGKGKRKEVAEPAAGVGEAVKRRRSANKAVNYDEDDEDEDGRKTNKATSRAPTTARRERRVSSVAASARAGSPDSVPGAGPSRARFNPVEEVIPPVAGPSRAVSAAPSTTADIKPFKSKLPASRPFERVFGCWRDDGWMYPGTIIQVTSGTFQILFDDESKGRLKPEEVRRCELQRGDFVRYRGDEEPDTETQFAVLAEDVQVFRVERGDDGEDAQGELKRDDVVAATNPNIPLADQPKFAAQDRLQRLQVAAIAIHPSRTHQFDNRRLTNVELAAFEGRTLKATKPLSLLSVPLEQRLPSVAVNRSKDGVFSRMGFLVTSAESTNEADKTAFATSLTEHGATILEVGHLFSVQKFGEDQKLAVKFHDDDFGGVDTIVLVADRPCTTNKYLIALALGIPCISQQFVHASIKDVSLLPRLAKSRALLELTPHLSRSGCPPRLEAFRPHCRFPPVSQHVRHRCSTLIPRQAVLRHFFARCAPRSRSRVSFEIVPRRMRQEAQSRTRGTQHSFSSICLPLALVLRLLTLTAATVSHRSLLAPLGRGQQSRFCCQCRLGVFRSRSRLRLAARRIARAQIYDERFEWSQGFGQLNLGQAVLDRRQVDRCE